MSRDVVRVCVGGGGGATGAHAPATFTPPPPRGPLTRICGVTIVNFLGMLTRLPVAKCALLMGIN